MPSLVLVGARGSGKTSVGKRVAKELGLPFFDTDRLVTDTDGRTIPEIFSADGEERFRELEVAALVAALASGPAVVATGGGIVLRPENRARLCGAGLVVWLTAPAGVLHARIAGDENRPALTALGPLEEITELLARREPLYREVADSICDTGRTRFDDLIDALARQWRARFPETLT